MVKTLGVKYFTDLLISYQNSIQIQNNFSIIWIAIFFIILVISLANVFKKKNVSSIGSIVLGSFLLLFSTLTLNTIEAVVAIESIEKYFWDFKMVSFELDHSILIDMSIYKFIFRVSMYLASICAILGAFFINNPVRKIIRLDE